MRKFETETHGGQTYAALLVKASYKPAATVGVLPAVGGDVVARHRAAGKKEYGGMGRTLLFIPCVPGSAALVPGQTDVVPGGFAFVPSNWPVGRNRTGAEPWLR
jgi:hypothetical protein